MRGFLDLTVADVMTRDPVVIAGDRPLSEAAAAFDEHDFNALPVVAAGGRLVGLLTKLDLLRACVFEAGAKFPHYEEILTRRVDEFAERSPECVRPGEPLTRVLQRMVETQRKSFPVVDDGRLLGMVSREDLIGALRRSAPGRG
jgi:CBS domain-containing protein